MATLASRQQTIDAYVEARLAPNVADLQAAYLAQHGSYFQGIWTHDAPVPDGGASAPDLTRKPPPGSRGDGLSHDWIQVGAAPLFPGNGNGAMDARVSCDTYVGPLGQGYIIRAQIAHGGRVYERAWAFGPYADMLSTAWLDATVETV